MAGMILHQVDTKEAEIQHPALPGLGMSCVCYRGLLLHPHSGSDTSATGTLKWTLIWSLLVGVCVVRVIPWGYQFTNPQGLKESVRDGRAFPSSQTPALPPASSDLWKHGGMKVKRSWAKHWPSLSLFQKYISIHVQPWASSQTTTATTALSQ